MTSSIQIHLPTESIDSPNTLDSTDPKYGNV
jgi:hypothetical protein